MVVALGLVTSAHTADLPVAAPVTVATPTWYISVAALALQRSTPSNDTIVSSNPTGTQFMGGGAFDFGWSAGVDATIGARIFGNDSLEARFMYSKMDADYSFVSPGSFIGVGFTGPGGITFNSEYETELTNWEVNWRHHFNERLSVLGGFRSITIDDTMSTVLSSAGASSIYDAANDMLGAQVGAQFSFFEQSNPFQLDVVGKVGIFSNKSSAGTQEFFNNNFIFGYQSGSVRETNYAAELGVSAGYEIFKNFSVTGGYQLLWVNDVALASNAAGGSLVNPALLTTNVYRDDILFHGFNLGLKMSF